MNSVCSDALMPPTPGLMPLVDWRSGMPGLPEPTWNSLSPLRYPGGKSLLTPLIMKLLGFTTSYHEVFAGGASVGFTIRRRWPWARCRLNDRDPALTDFYTVLRDYPRDLRREVKRVFRDFTDFDDAIEFHYAVRPHLRGPRLNDMQRAVAYYLCNRIGFSGITVEAGGTTGRKMGRRLNDRLIDTLPFWSSVLQGVEITTEDYRATMGRVGRDEVAFADSPYEVVEGGADRDIYWCDPWRRDDFMELADHLIALDRRHARWVTTLMLSPETEQLFLDKLSAASSRIHAQHLPVRHSLVQRTAEELIIWNFPVPTWW